MKTPIAMALIIVGGVLIVAPVLSGSLNEPPPTTNNTARVPLLPDELRPKPYRAYDWACMATGAVMGFIGIRGSGPGRESPANLRIAGESGRA
jgi:hypothetical protein